MQRRIHSHTIFAVHSAGSRNAATILHSSFIHQISIRLLKWAVALPDGWWIHVFLAKKDSLAVFGKNIVENVFALCHREPSALLKSIFHIAFSMVLSAATIASHQFHVKSPDRLQQMRSIEWEASNPLPAFPPFTFTDTCA